MAWRIPPPAKSLENVTPANSLENPTLDASGTVNVTFEAEMVTKAPEIPDHGLRREIPPLRRSPRFSHNDSLGLFSVQSDLSDERDQETAEEEPQGELSISFNAVNVNHDISKLYKKSLTHGQPEIESPEILEEEVKEIISPLHKSALKKRRCISFFIPELSPFLIYPEKDLEIRA